MICDSNGSYIVITGMYRKYLGHQLISFTLPNCIAMFELSLYFNKQNDELIWTRYILEISLAPVGMLCDRPVVVSDGVIWEADWPDWPYYKGPLSMQSTHCYSLTHWPLGEASKFPIEMHFFLSYYGSVIIATSNSLLPFGPKLLIEPVLTKC